VYASLEGLKLVNDPNPIDLALVPGGVGGRGRFPNVRQVAALGIDPLHVMVRPELYESATRSLTALRGKRINCATRSINSSCTGGPSCTCAADNLS
jgi:hypothetical protein